MRSTIGPKAGLAFGASNLAARWRSALAMPLSVVLARPHALAAWRDAPAPDAGGADDLIVVNAAALPGRWFDAVRTAIPPAVFTAGEAIVAARVSAAQFQPALVGAAAPDDVLRSLGARVR